MAPTITPATAGLPKSSHSWNQNGRVEQKIKPFATLDLHGHTKEQAIRAVTNFWEASTRNSKSRKNPWVCVITGTGAHSGALGGPVLKQAIHKLLLKREMEFSYTKKPRGMFLVNVHSGHVLKLNPTAQELHAAGEGVDTNNAPWQDTKVKVVAREHIPGATAVTLPKQKPLGKKVRKDRMESAVRVGPQHASASATAHCPLPSELAADQKLLEQAKSTSLQDTRKWKSQRDKEEYALKQALQKTQQEALEDKRREEEELQHIMELSQQEQDDSEHAAGEEEAELGRILQLSLQEAQKPQASQPSFDEEEWQAILSQSNLDFSQQQEQQQLDEEAELERVLKLSMEESKQIVENNEVDDKDEDAIREVLRLSLVEASVNAGLDKTQFEALGDSPLGKELASPAMQLEQTPTPMKSEEALEAPIVNEAMVPEFSLYQQPPVQEDDVPEFSLFQEQPVQEDDGSSVTPSLEPSSCSGGVPMDHPQKYEYPAWSNAASVSPHQSFMVEHKAMAVKTNVDTDYQEPTTNCQQVSIPIPTSLHNLKVPEQATAHSAVVVQQPVHPAIPSERNEFRLEPGPQSNYSGDQNIFKEGPTTQIQQQTNTLTSQELEQEGLMQATSTPIPNECVLPSTSHASTGHMPTTPIQPPMNQQVTSPEELSPGEALLESILYKKPLPPAQQQTKEELPQTSSSIQFNLDSPTKYHEVLPAAGQPLQTAPQQPVLPQAVIEHRLMEMLQRPIALSSSQPAVQPIGPPNTNNSALKPSPLPQLSTPSVPHAFHQPVAAQPSNHQPTIVAEKEADRQLLAGLLLLDDRYT